MNLNKVILIGRVTKDPEMRSTTGGTATARIGLATNRIYKDKQGNKKEQTQFHNCVAFGRTAEIIGQFVSRGQLLMVEGRVETRSWENREGVKSYITEIIIENIQMGPKPAAREPEQAPPEATAAKQEDDIPTIEEGQGIDVKDIPF
jgi:single-strand DNA-binding protein